MHPSLIDLMSSLFLFAILVFILLLLLVFTTTCSRASPWSIPLFSRAIALACGQRRHLDVGVRQPHFHFPTLPIAVVRQSLAGRRPKNPMVVPQYFRSRAISLAADVALALANPIVVPQYVLSRAIALVIALSLSLALAHRAIEACLGFASRRHVC